jgi:hypothetical protein
MERRERGCRGLLGNSQVVRECQAARSIVEEEAPRWRRHAASSTEEGDDAAAGMEKSVPRRLKSESQISGIWDVQYGPYNR